MGCIYHFHTDKLKVAERKNTYLGLPSLSLPIGKSVSIFLSIDDATSSRGHHAGQLLYRETEMLKSNITETNSLTNREKEVLLWMSHGKTAWETSVILKISKATVNSHLLNTRTKLNTTNLAQTIAEAIRRNLISD